AMQLNSLFGGKVFLFVFELSRQVQQAHFLLLFGDYLVKKSQMVAEEKDGCWMVDFGVFAYKVLKEDGRHRGDVFVAETQISAGKAGVARLHVTHALLVLSIQHVPGKDFLRDGHRPLSSLNRGEKHSLLHPRHVEWEQSAILDHLTRDIVFA